MVRQVQERVPEVDLAAPDFVDIVPDYFGVGLDDWTVIVVVSGLLLLQFVDDCRVEDPADVTVGNQIHDAAVDVLGQVTDRVGRDRFHPFFVLPLAPLG